MAANVFRVTLIQTMYGQQLENVLHLSGPSSDPLQMSTLADAIEANWVNQVRFRQQSNLNYIRINVRLLESQFPPFDKTINILGSQSPSDQHHLVICHVLQIRTAVIGKHGRGRVYIGGLQNNTTSNGLLNSTTITNWNNQIAAILAAFGPGGSTAFRLGVTRKQNPAANFNEVVTMQVASKPGTQRRRGAGVGV